MVTYELAMLPPKYQKAITSIFSLTNLKYNSLDYLNCYLRAISTVFHNNNPFIEFSNFLTSVVEFNGEFENKKKK